MNYEILDLYTDYLISSFSQTTATGMSRMLDGEKSHDQITRFLSKQEFTGKDLWKLIKKDLRRIESESEGCIIFDDTVIEKMYTDESAVMCWHFDHSKNRNVKGMNLLNCIYSSQGVKLPLNFHIVEKPILFSDIKTQKVRRKGTITKNELLRSMIQRCKENQVLYRYILMDRWFSSKENLQYIHQKTQKIFIAALKSNRTVSLSEEEKKEGTFQRVDQLQMEENETKKVWLKGLVFPVLLTKQIFTNKDGSTGILFLICNDLTLTYEDITTTYQKRWDVEVYHKSLKSNTGMAKSPTRSSVTQKNHCFASIYAFVKLERITSKIKTNHFALKNKIYLSAIQKAFKELKKYNAGCINIQTA